MLGEQLECKKCDAGAVADEKQLFKNKDDLMKKIFEDQKDEEAWIKHMNKENNKKWILFCFIIFGVIILVAAVGLKIRK